MLMCRPQDNTIIYKYHFENYMVIVNQIYLIK